MKEIFKIERSKRGLPVMWESGGGYSNTGEVLLIANHRGEPKKALTVKTRGHLSNAQHALVAVREGDYIVHTAHARKDFTISIYKIVGFTFENRKYGFGKDEFIKIEFAVGELQYRFENNWWNEQLPDFLSAVVDASVNKALHYHCREPYFVKVKERR